MLPLTYIGVPVAEITLTLMLSLRFITLVFDEVRELMSNNFYAETIILFLFFLVI
jgi:energy-coupling factor transporter transmembrane protein EcfT